MAKIIVGRSQRSKKSVLLNFPVKKYVCNCKDFGNFISQATNERLLFLMKNRA